jgi:hypothetical protein
MEWDADLVGLTFFIKFDIFFRRTIDVRLL